MTMTNKPRQVLLCSLGVLFVLAAREVRAAETCPETPADAKERRTLAKDWFAKAESAERVSDDLGAMRAYACSMRMVPHADTAYNLGRVAEKAGDLEIALASYKNYLTLKPEANDKADIDGRIRSLESRIAAVRNAMPANQAPPPPPDARPEPVAAPPTVTARAGAREPSSAPSAMGATEWVIAGVGAAALVAGIVFNVGARSKMSDCRSLADQNKLTAARDACDAAKPFAYTSYGLFGAAGAAAVLDLVLVLSKPSGSDEKVGLSVVPGGAALTLGGRF
jgi:hypothetical protein